MGNTKSKIVPITTNDAQTTPIEVVLSDEEIAINKIVDRYLQNSHINNPFIPDVIEKKIYANVIKLMLGVVKDTIEHTNVDIFGHRINFTMTPLTEERDLDHEVSIADIMRYAEN